VWTNHFQRNVDNHFLLLILQNVKECENSVNNTCLHINAEMLMCELNNKMRIYLCPQAIAVKTDCVLPGEGCFTSKSTLETKKWFHTLLQKPLTTGLACWKVSQTETLDSASGLGTAAVTVGLS
jgi:hypothetical protein